MQRKHKAFNNKLYAFCTTGGKTNPYIKQDKLGLNTEMAIQFVRLKMEAIPILHVQSLIHITCFALLKKSMYLI